MIASPLEQLQDITICLRQIAVFETKFQDFFIVASANCMGSMTISLQANLISQIVNKTTAKSRC